MGSMLTPVNGWRDLKLNGCGPEAGVAERPLLGLDGVCDGHALEKRALTHSARAAHKLLTVEETAERLNVSVRNVRHHIYRRRLPIVKIGRLVRIEERDLEAFIERGRIGWQ